MVFLAAHPSPLSGCVSGVKLVLVMIKTAVSVFCVEVPLNVQTEGVGHIWCVL